MIENYCSGIDMTFKSQIKKIVLWFIPSSKERLKKMSLYWAEWLIPSSTAAYIILHEWYGYNMIPSYIVASLLPGIIYYPLNKYIFKKDI